MSWLHNARNSISINFIAQLSCWPLGLTGAHAWGCIVRNTSCPVDISTSDDREMAQPPVCADLPLCLLYCAGASADAFASTFNKGHKGAAVADASASAAALGGGGVAIADAHASAKASSNGGVASE